MKKDSRLRIMVLAGVLAFILGLRSLAQGVGSPGKTSAPPPLSLDQVIARLQDNYKKINTYQAGFDQELFNPAQNRVVSQGRGTVIYKKPAKMVWRYVKPEEHYYIADGSTMYDYSPADKVVYVLPIREALYKSFLFGLGDIKKEFEVSFTGGQPRNAAGQYQLDLLPKNQEDRANIGRITLFLDPNTFLVQEAQTVDALGNQNRIKFRDIKVNPQLADSLFKFVPPPGVQVIQPEDKPPTKGKPADKPK